MTFESLRGELPITKKFAYFQTGSYGPTPLSVLQVVQESMRYLSECAASPETHVFAEREMAVKRQLADFLHVQPEDLAWLPNTTQAMQRVLHSIRWQAGDELIISSHEHVSTVEAASALNKWYGVKVKAVAAHKGDDVLLDGISSALTPRTRLVFLSHVTSQDGRRLPVAQASTVAHEHGVPVAVDAAQSIGQFDVDIPILGCDYVVASAHKWLLGPMGLGYIWIAPDRVKDFRPDFYDDYSPWLKPSEPRPPITAATRVEKGTHNYAIPIGLGRALQILTDLGMESVETRGRQLTDLFLDGIQGLDGVQILSATDPARATGIVALTFDGYDEPHLRGLIDELYQRRIVVKFQPEFCAMRISFACFNTEEEVQRLLDAMECLYRPR